MVDMADQEKGRRLIPPKTSRQRTIVYLVLVAVVAIVLIVVALALATPSNPNQTGNKVPSGGYNTPPPTTTNVTSQDVKVGTFSIDQNATTGDTTFLVTVTNTGVSNLTRNLNVAVSQTPGVTPPNQPYPSRETPPNNPVLTNSTVVTLAPGETKTVPVVVQTPPGFAVVPGNVVITFT